MSELGKIELIHLILPDQSVDVESERFKLLTESIKAYGICAPLFVTKKGNKYEVINGLSRLAIAKQLNIATVPCVILTEEEAVFHSSRISRNFALTKLTKAQMSKVKQRIKEPNAYRI